MALAFAPSKASAQDMHVDSAFTKLNWTRNFVEKLVVKNEKEWLEFDDTEKTDEEKSSNNDTYGIGNVIDKKKKSVKAKKKAGKKVKVEFNLTKEKVISFEIILEKGNFEIKRLLATD